MLDRTLVVTAARADGSVAVHLVWHPCTLLARLHDEVAGLRAMARAQRVHAASHGGAASLALSRVMHKTLERATRVLLRARRLADAALLADGRVDARLASASSELGAFSRELRAHVGGWEREQADAGVAVGGPARSGRAAMLADEARDLADAVRLARSEEIVSRLRLLRAAVESLRALEAQLPFRAQLLRAQLQASRAGYSTDNFAYGSTPFGTWAALAACAPVAGALEALRAGAGHALVAGSSAGWFCFYLALHGGVPVVGFELLPALHAAAERIRDGLAARSALPRIELRCADVLDADMRAARLVVLASQCWDAQLHAAVCTKLRAECPAGAIVIDYRPPPPTWADDDNGSGAPAQRELRLASRVQGRVSWELEFSFCILEVVAVC